MNLLEAYRNRGTARGFTLIELMLVIALMLMIGFFAYPLGLSFYQTQLLNDTEEGLSSALQRAQISALTDKHSSSFGVKVLQNAYVLFGGDSYATRREEEDEISPISSSVALSGIDEVVFARLSGEPSIIGTFNLTSGEREEHVDITASGNISW